MCQTAVYLVHEGKEELVLQDVVNITPEGATLKLVNLFGEEKVVRGKDTSDRPALPPDHHQYSPRPVKGPRTSCPL